MLAVLLVQTAVSTFAQPLDHWSLGSSKDLLSEPLPFYQKLMTREIHQVFQDTEGFIWLGTADGVARYDGYETFLFRSDYRLPNRLADNRITCLADDERYVYIGTRGGLNIFDKQQWQMAQARDSRFARTEIRDLLRDRGGRLWVATAGHLYVIKGSTVSDCHFTYPVNRLYEDREGEIWVTTWNHGLYRMKADGQAEKFPPVGQHDNPFAIVEDHHGHYFIGSWYDGLYRFNPQTKEYFRLPLQENRVYSIIESGGNLTILTDGKAYLMVCNADGTLTEQPLPHDFDRQRMFTNVMADRRGDLWFGAYDTGYHLYHSDPGVRSFALSAIPRQMHIDVSLKSVAYDSGWLWLNVERYGYLLFNPTTGEMKLPNHPFEVDHIESGTWMAKRDEPVVCHVSHVDGNITIDRSFTLSLPDGEKVGSILQVHEDKAASKREQSQADFDSAEREQARTKFKKGNLWIPTTRHLFSVHSEKCIVHSYTDVICVCDDDKNGVILGQKDGTLVFTDRKAKLPLKPGDELVCMAQQGHDVWVATRLGMILRYQMESGETEDHTRQSIGSGSSIIRLLANEQFLWIVTLSEAICYDYQKGHSWHYPAGDKSICVEAFRGRAATLSPDGTLYAGGSGGLVAIRPSEAEEDIDTMAVSDVRINGQSLLASDSIPVTFTEGHQLIVPANADHIDISLTAFNYHSQHRLRFCYRLDGGRWLSMEAGQNRISLSNLSAGTYTLQFSQADINGSPIGKVFSFSFIKQPHWYETWWFRLLIVLLLLSVIGIALWWYERRTYQKTAQVITHINTDEDDLFLQKIEAYVLQHINDTVSLDAVASVVAMSKSTLARKVKSLTGLTPMDYVKNIRFRHACDLLRRGDMNISEVAYAVGFTNPKYFAKCFKDEFGLTPTQYQQKKQA